VKRSRARHPARAALLVASLALHAAGCGNPSPADYTEAEARAYLAARGFEFTPEELARSAREDALDVVIAFLAAGIDPDALGGRAAALAAGRGTIEVLRLLLEAGADPNLPGGSFGQTPLIAAVLRDRIEAAELLLEAGADPDARTRSGAVALHFAKDVETARLLLEAGADPGLADSRGATPLMGAILLGDVGLIELLLEHGADPNATDQDGRSALLYAKVMHFSEIEERLLAAGAKLPRPQLGIATLATYVGRYRGDRTHYEIVLERDGLLLIQVAGDGLLFASELVPLTPTTFYRSGDPGLVLFAIEIEDGRVTGLSRTGPSGWVTVPRLEETALD
jgi:hypothetical protein